MAYDKSALQKTVSAFMDIFDQGVPKKSKKKKPEATITSGPARPPATAAPYNPANNLSVPGMSASGGVYPSALAPPAPVDSVTAGAKNPVIAALERALASIPSAPSRGDFLAPYGEAEGRAQSAYDESLPVITQAFMDLKGKLDTGQQGATTEAAMGAAQRQQQLAAGLAQVQGLQAQAQQDLATQGGAAGGVALGSLTSAAQAQAGATNAALALQGSQEQQGAAQRQASLEAQFADRRSAADAGEYASKDNARANLNSILNQIGVQKSNAEKEYMQMVNSQANQRASAEVDLARAQAEASAQPSEKDELDLMLKRIQVQKAMEGDKPERGLPSANDYGPVAQTSPNAFGYFSKILAAAGSKSDRVKAEKVLLDDIAEADKAGLYDRAADSVVVDGNRLSLGWLRTWLDQYYGGNGSSSVDG